VVWLVSLITERFRRLSKRIQDSMGYITHVTQEVIEGNQVVKVFGGQEYEEGNFEKVNEFNRQQRMKMEVTRSLSNGVIQLVIALGFAAVIYFATSGMLGITVSAGAFVSMMMALMLMQQPIKRLTTVNAQLQQGIAASDKIFSFIDTLPESDTGGRILPRAAGHVSYEGVTFCYDKAKGKVINDVSFEVEPGQTIAFVGRSGSGKSTLASLLARFYDPDEGTIRIDGIDTRDINLSSLRDNIALVTQHVTLFNDTVGNNIAYGGLSGATPEQIRAAAEHAHVTEFVDRMPEGLDTLVGENGVMLSGGQRQRLAIARALLKDAPILILDEATSALDTESERHIQAALQELISNRTTFVIAHRLSTIEKADRIIVMHEGRIVEQGNHEELLAKGGHYAKLYNMQFSD
jgi:subfamily B ATP-binding cassette protein MsbA